MLRFRKYRVFLIFAAILVITLYNFWEPGPGSSFGNSHASGDGKSAQNGDRDGAKKKKKPVDIQGIAHPEDSDDSKTIHWRKPTEYYPVAAEDLIHLPSGTPKKMPRIQFEFPVESAEAKKIRVERRDKVKAEFLHAWKGYKKHAWGHDEVGPVNGGSRDPFCGWAATMVDSLDTLWIMGLKDEFEEALKSVKKIDFTTSPKSSIPVFETTIRYLGGLLAAYDISEEKYPILLTKATELGEILMSIFDTPNRMPVLHYGWQPHSANERHRAAGNSNFAELGTLCLEFTRLAQLTGEDKYYDAVARITNALVEWQEAGTVEIKGIFPDSVDASGCNSTFVPEDEEPAENATEKALGARDAEAFCRPQGLTKGPSRESYSMGGGQDSTYEYFSKMWLLLGGLDTTYRTLYLNTMHAIRTHLLYRPLIPGGRDVLFTSKMQINPYLAGDSNRETIYEVTHLSCFIGGMVGMGAKLFGLDSDLPIAERLSDGCVWAYESTRSGVMPEDARAVPCENPLDCEWSEERYYKYLDPRWALRPGEIEKYDAEKVRQEEERVAKARIEKAREEEEKKEKVLLDEAYGVTRRSEGGATKYSLDGTAVESSEHDVEAIDANNPSPVNINHKRPFSNSTSTATTSDDDALPTLPPYVAPTKTENVPINPHARGLPKDRSDPYRPLTHEEYISDFMGRNTLPLGFAKVESDKYILRPEAIESVFYMHRITGSPTWPEKGWKMFTSIIAATRTEIGHSAVIGVNREPAKTHKQDSMESFWLAETLKYFYLLYSEPELVSLDEWVLNTEAHPFRRPSP